jgi:hypothetical protein
MIMNVDFDSARLKVLFKEIGLYGPKEEFYIERRSKHKQVLSYIVQVKAALRKLSSKRPIVLLDCGCGKSYLSFILYEYCQTVLGREVKIIGVDNNLELIESCKKTAKELKFSNMQFHSLDVAAFKPEENVDIVYSLHACDTATDQTIAKGIALQAKYILSVSCCQHTNRKKMAKHPLKNISKHHPYKERLADMIGDSMRALLLEHFGYGVKIFEFVAAEQTPKNIMLRAVNLSVKKQDKENAMASYRQLVEMFNFSPALADLLELSSLR